jgi:hypothetical protein
MQVGIGSPPKTAVYPDDDPTGSWEAGRGLSIRIGVFASRKQPNRSRPFVTAPASIGSAREPPLVQGGPALVSIEHAVGKRSRVGGGIGSTRQTARNPGYATIAGQVNLFGWHEVAGTTLFANGAFR